MKIAIAQFNATVGDLDGNAAKLLDQARQAAAAGATLMLAPELALCGYPPEDLALRPDFYTENARVLESLAARLPTGLALLLGHPLEAGLQRYNAASVLRDGQIIATYRKQTLPNHTVFDEVRTFAPGDAACVFELDGVRFGVNICADIWEPGTATQARDAGAEVLLVLNASPFHMDKQLERRQIARQRVGECGLPLIYANLVGGQDELVFDGASFALSGDGGLAAQFPAFVEGLYWLDLENLTPRGDIQELPDSDAMAYQALVLGVRDYVAKNGFPGVLLGLSGGIDSALTLVVAVDAIGADKVQAVMMPSQFTANISLEDAEALAVNLKVRYDVQPIKRMFDTFMEELSDEFENLPFDQTEENIQARIRGVLLMALSNKFGQLVLTTGNKSEMASGYATLYGDMAGGLAVLKDVPKTLVWRLSRYRNSISSVIPERIITRPPSAELRANQCDQDSLPPYDVLDAIMERYVERDMSPRDIIADGYSEAAVRQVVSLIDRSEYKRRQSPPGIRITARGFGRDRRYPITNKYRAP
ncbi:MAG: NAD+ synthase [Pseudomonadota bacterium]|nr:NAD+ synthase [Pseudomonadota bacterium]MDP1904366.1 NAD+ synthase [Pseudomonadota bacterium]MDP2353519.1 NAD+ synthase [Pseudomonadota bacterium]